MNAACAVRRVATALLLGAASGAVFLGAGGRLAMRVFAVATARVPTFSVRGSLTVVLYGALVGAIGGALYYAVVCFVPSRFLPGRGWLRGVVFAGLGYVLASPGFRPPQLLVFALFAPAFLGYGLALNALVAHFMREPFPSPEAR